MKTVRMFPPLLPAVLLYPTGPHDLLGCITYLQNRTLVDAMTLGEKLTALTLTLTFSTQVFVLNVSVQLSTLYPCIHKSHCP